MKKRIFSLLLVIAMLVTVLPVNAFAADDCPMGSHTLNVRMNRDGTHTAFCAYNWMGCDYEVTSPCSWGACKYSDSTQHYQQCTVCKDYKYSNHNCTNWTVSGQRHSGTCSDCGRTISGYCITTASPTLQLTASTGKNALSAANQAQRLPALPGAVLLPMPTVFPTA